MDLTSKLTAGLFAAACVCSLAAAELSISEPADFTQPRRASKSDDGIIVKGAGFQLFSAKTLTLDPAKKYKVSGEFRLKEGEESGAVYLGLVPLNAEGKQITSGSVNVVPKSDTVVAKAAAAGDTVVYVEDASKWNKETPYAYIAFNTKPDYSDLPNSDTIKIPKGEIAQEGELWKVTLKTPLTKDIPAGTGVRQQRAGAAYIYSGYKRNMPQEWTTLSGVISGSVAKSGIPTKQLWPATASVRVVVMMLDGKKGNVIEFRNVTVEEVAE